MAKKEKLTPAQKQKIAKQLQFDKVRVQWFDQYMHHELPSLRSMHIPEDRAEVLTREEQMSLSMLIQAGITAKVLLATIDNSIFIQDSIKPEVVEQIRRLLAEQDYKAEDLDKQQKKRAYAIMQEAETARHVFAEHNLGIVDYLAGKYIRSKGLNSYLAEEVKHEGQIGLMQAIDRYNPSMGFAFSTPAAPWITQAFRKFVDNKVKTIRMPQNMNAIYRNIQYAQKILRDKYPDDSYITDEKILAFLQSVGAKVGSKPFSAEDMEKAKAFRKETSSYNAENADNDMPIIGLIASDEHLEENVVSTANANDDFNTLLSLVDDHRKREILRDWYSSGDEHPLVILSNVSRKHALTKERTRQLKGEAEQEIKKKLIAMPEEERYAYTS